MDPNACMTRLLDAVREHDYFEALNAARDLRGWLDGGGFLPTLDRAQLWVLVTATTERLADIVAAEED